MKKSILNLTGAKELSKREQKTINGGVTSCFTDAQCGVPPAGTVYRCIRRVCKLELLP